MRIGVHNAVPAFLSANDLLFYNLLFSGFLVDEEITPFCLISLIIRKSTTPIDNDADTGRENDDN